MADPHLELPGEAPVACSLHRGKIAVAGRGEDVVGGRLDGKVSSETCRTFLSARVPWPGIPRLPQSTQMVTSRKGVVELRETLGLTTLPQFT